MDSSRKVIFLTNIPAPYRVDFFNELNKYYELKVVFYAKEMGVMGWKDSVQSYEFEHEFLYNEHKIKWIYSLYSLIKKNKKDIFVIGGYSLLPEMLAIFLLKLMKRDFLINLDGGFIREYSIKTILKERLIKSATYCLSSGKNTTKTLIHYGAKAENIREYHFSSLHEKEVLEKPLSINDKNILRDKWGIKKDAPYLIYVGQLIHRKGVDFLLEALKDTEVHINLLIIGDGELREGLEDYVKKNGLLERVSFLGTQSKENVLELMKLSDVFVLPTREDIWGLVVNEAIACGLPVIATYQTGAAYSLIEPEKNGYIYQAENVSELIELINKIFKENLSQFSELSLQIARKYTIEQMVTDHRTTFSKI